MKKIPVILDTDIGCDIDDAWALAMLLNCPQLDLKLVLVGTGNVEYRARNVAKMLDIAQRTDVPVALGLPSDGTIRSVEQWLQDYPLDRYPGPIEHDGVTHANQLINNSPDPITVIGIGPMINLAAMLDADPNITKNSKLVAMCGSINQGLQGKPGRVAEWNVLQNIPAAQKVFSSNWHITFTPLDTCGHVLLQNQQYQTIKNSHHPLIAALIEQYQIWDQKYQHNLFQKQSSALFDTVAVYLAYTHQHLDIQPMTIRIDNQGHMIPDPQAKTVHCALKWKNLQAFKDHLIQTLCPQAQ